MACAYRPAWRRFLRLLRSEGIPFGICSPDIHGLDAGVVHVMGKLFDFIAEYDTLIVRFGSFGTSTALHREDQKVFDRNQAGWQELRAWVKEQSIPKGETS